jgi:hypothetical protein
MNIGLPFRNIRQELLSIDKQSAVVWDVRAAKNVSDGVSGEGGRKSKNGVFVTKIHYSDQFFARGVLILQRKKPNSAHPAVSGFLDFPGKGGVDAYQGQRWSLVSPGGNAGWPKW